LISQHLSTNQVKKLYVTINFSLSEFEQQTIEEWGRYVELSSRMKLKLLLFTRNPATRLLTANFDAALVKLLREVRYFLLLELPALEIY
jgi:dynein heavy chain, axonemal